MKKLLSLGLLAVLCPAAFANVPVGSFTVEGQVDFMTMGRVEFPGEVDPRTRSQVRWPGAMIPDQNGTAWIAVYRQFHQSIADSAAACAFEVDWGGLRIPVSLPDGLNGPYDPSLQAAIRLAPFVHNYANPSIWTLRGLYPDGDQFGGMTVCVAQVPFR